MVLIFNNAATCHAYERGGGSSAQQYECEPKRGAKKIFIHTAALAGWGLHVSVPGKRTAVVSCGGACNLAISHLDRDKQMKT